MVLAIARAFLFVIFFTLPISMFAFENKDSFQKNKSKYKVLVFLSKGCPCSRSHVEHLNTIQKKYKEVSIFGVVTDSMSPSTEKEINEYYVNKRFNFPVVLDENQELVRKYRALKTPHIVLLRLGKNKKYVMLYQGGLTDSRKFSKSSKKFLAENLQALSQGKSVKYKVGKSLGCYIRRI